MAIQITTPEVEGIINRRLLSGEFKNAEDVILQALRALPQESLKAVQAQEARSSRSLRELFEAVRGLADDADFSRDPSGGRSIDLSRSDFFLTPTSRRS